MAEMKALGLMTAKFLAVISIILILCIVYFSIPIENLFETKDTNASTNSNDTTKPAASDSPSELKISDFRKELTDLSQLDASYISRYQYSTYYFNIQNRQTERMENSINFVERSRNIQTHGQNFYYDIASPIDNIEARERSYFSLEEHTQELLLDKEIYQGEKASEVINFIDGQQISTFLDRIGLSAEELTEELVPELIWQKVISYAGASYEVSYYFWPVKDDFSLPAVLYRPLVSSNQKVPIVFTPLGCGAGLGTFASHTNVQRRMANLALRGIASFSMVGLCTNEPLTSRSLGNAYARQHSAIFAFSGVNPSNFGIGVLGWLRAYNHLKEQQRFDFDRVGLTGYSYGGVMTFTLAGLTKAKAALVVATNVNKPIINDFSLTTRWNIMLGSDDQIYSIDETRQAIAYLTEIQSRLDLEPALLTVVPGAHNFGKDRRIIAYDWLVDALESEPLVSNAEGSELETPELDFGLPVEIEARLLTNTIHDLYSALAESRKADLLPTDFAEWPDSVSSNYLRKLLGYEKRYDENFSSPPFLVNRATIEFDPAVEYRAWVIEIEPGIQCLVIELSAIPTTNEEIASSSVFLSTETYTPNLNEIEKRLEEGESVFSLIIPGYGLMSDSQQTTGNLARRQYDSFTLLGMATEAIINVRNLAKIRYPNASFSVVSNGVETAIPGLIAMNLDSSIAGMTEYESVDSLDDILNNQNHPIIPPILLVPSIYSRIDLPLLREASLPRASNIISTTNLRDFAATQ